MARIGLYDYDGRLPNLALMQLSTYHKAQGDTVVLNDFGARDVDKVYCSVIFTRNKAKAERLQAIYPSIEFGGTGYDYTKTLPAEVAACRPDYDLYRVEHILPRLKGIMKAETKRQKAQTLVDAGIGFTTRGCVRTCGFCIVPKKEGQLHSVGNIGDLLNPRSNVLILMDNNLTADPDCLAKLHECRDRSLTIDISQGIDVRFVTPEIAKALAEVKHLRSLHYAWDLMPFEHQVMDGIKELLQHINPWKHLCFTLAGYNTSFDEDMYRVRRLIEMKVSPYVMIYDQRGDARLKHFARWVNGRFYKTCSFDDYWPWAKEKASYTPELALA